MKEFAATIKLHNNLLRERREMLGLTPRQLSERVGIAYEIYVGLENLRGSPVNGRGGWRPAAEKIAAFFGEQVETLFPEVIRAVKSNHGVVKLAAPDVAMLAASAERFQSLAQETPEDHVERSELVGVVADALETLTPQEQRVLRKRYGIGDGSGATIEGVGDALGLSRERIRQIEARALRKLRHPSRAKRLMAYSGHDNEPHAPSPEPAAPRPTRSARVEDPSDAEELAAVLLDACQRGLDEIGTLWPCDECGVDAERLCIPRRPGGAVHASRRAIAQSAINSVRGGHWRGVLSAGGPDAVERVLASIRGSLMFRRLTELGLMEVGAILTFDTAIGGEGGPDA